LHARTLQALATAPLKKSPGRLDFQRGILSGPEWLEVRSTGSQDSGVFSSLSRANCYIVLEQERGSVAAGETVTVEPFSGLLLSEIMSDAEPLRYNRQIVLKSFDFEGRRRSSNPACWSSAPGAWLRRQPYLAVAGVGHLTLVDFDRVELSNLQRQCCTATRASASSVESAATSLRALTPGSRWRPTPPSLTRRCSMPCCQPSAGARLHRQRRHPQPPQPACPPAQGAPGQRAAIRLEGQLPAHLAGG
jgi:hypothetical protein